MIPTLKKKLWIVRSLTRAATAGSAYSYYCAYSVAVNNKDSEVQCLAKQGGCCDIGLNPGDEFFSSFIHGEQSRTNNLVVGEICLARKV